MISFDNFDGIPTHVCTAEHLCALALQTGTHTDIYGC
jgi:hypothetical protein